MVWAIFPSSLGLSAALRPEITPHWASILSLTPHHPPSAYSCCAKVILGNQCATDLFKLTFETGSHCIAQTDFKLLPALSGWDLQE